MARQLFCAPVHLSPLEKQKPTVLRANPSPFPLFLTPSYGVVEISVEAVEGPLQLAMVHAVHEPQEVGLGHVRKGAEGGLQFDRLDRLLIWWSAGSLDSSGGGGGGS